jgi:hypothetical protein
LGGKSGVGAESSRQEAGWRFAVFLVVVVLAVLVVDLVAYRYDPPPVWYLPPNWSLAGLNVGTGALGLLAGLVLPAWKRVRNPVFTGYFVLVMVIMTVVITTWPYIFDTGWRCCMSG